MEDGEVSPVEPGESTVYSGGGDGDPWVLGNSVAEYSCCSSSGPIGKMSGSERTKQASD